MLPLPLVLDLVKMWALQQGVRKLRKYAADDRPDVQFDMPIIQQKWTSGCAQNLLRHRLHQKQSVQWKLLSTARSSGSSTCSRRRRSNHKVIASVRLVFCSSKSLSAIVCSLLA
jgi:hypothetical protein